MVVKRLIGFHEIELQTYHTYFSIVKISIMNIIRHPSLFKCQHLPTLSKSNSIVRHSRTIKSLIQNDKASLNKNTCGSVRPFYTSISKEDANESNMVPHFSKKEENIFTLFPNLHENETTSKATGFDSQDLKMEFNVIFKALMNQKNTKDKEIYKFIINNINCGLNHDLLESFIVVLLYNQNLAAATTLLHIIFDNQLEFQLSNEHWSYYLAKVCEISDFQGATLIFNELIDNYKFYDVGDCSPLLSNNLIPFLVTPTNLQNLAIIFAQNGDYMSVLGLTAYFKRFYSSIANSEIYRSLHVSLVEASSKQNDFDEAMYNFHRLATRSVNKVSNSEEYFDQHFAKWRAGVNYVKRKSSIKENNQLVNLEIPDELLSETELEQEMAAYVSGSKLHRPYEIYNRYTLDESRGYYRIIKRPLKVTDLPNFMELVKLKVLQINKTTESNTIDMLENVMSSHHYVFHRFLVAGLCDLKLLDEACYIFKRLPEIYSEKVHPNFLYGTDDFIYLSRCIYERMKAFENETQGIEKKKLLSMIQDINHLHYTLSDKYDFHLSFKAFSYLLQSMLTIPSLDFKQITNSLDHFINKRLQSESKSGIANSSVSKAFTERKLYLEARNFDTFEKLCQQNACTRYLKIVGKLAY